MILTSSGLIWTFVVLKILGCVSLGLTNGRHRCHCNSRAQSITAAWCEMHDGIFEPRLNGASFIQWICRGGSWASDHSQQPCSLHLSQGELEIGHEIRARAISETGFPHCWNEHIMMLEMSDACHLLCLYTSLSRLLFPPLASSLSRSPPGQTPFLIHLERVNLAEARVSVCFANVSFLRTCAPRVVAFRCIKRREVQLKAGHAAVNEVIFG